MDRAIQMTPMIMTRRITHAKIRNAKPVISTTLIRNHRRRFNRLARTRCPLILTPCGFPCHSCNNSRNAPHNRPCPIVNDINRRCAIPPVRFGQQPTNYAMCRHPASALYDAHQCMRSQSPFFRKTIPMVPLCSLPQRVTIKIRLNNNVVMLDKCLQYTPPP